MSTGREVHYLAEVDERETTNILPDKADMFLAYATVPGFRYQTWLHLFPITSNDRLIGCPISFRDIFARCY